MTSSLLQLPRVLPPHPSLVHHHPITSGPLSQALTLPPTAPLRLASRHSPSVDALLSNAGPIIRLRPSLPAVSPLSFVPQQISLTLLADRAFLAYERHVLSVLPDFVLIWFVLRPRLSSLATFRSSNDFAYPPFCALSPYPIISTGSHALALALCSASHLWAACSNRPCCTTFGPLPRFPSLAPTSA